MATETPNEVKPLETRPVSDHTKLIWTQIQTPIQQAVNAVNVALNTAQNLLANELAKAEGLNYEEGWRLNTSKMRFERYPVEEE